MVALQVKQIAEQVIKESYLLSTGWLNQNLAFIYKLVKDSKWLNIPQSGQVKSCMNHWSIEVGSLAKGS